MFWKVRQNCLYKICLVYTNFKEIGEFGDYIDELHGKLKSKNLAKHQEYINLAFSLAKNLAQQIKSISWVYYWGKW